MNRVVRHYAAYLPPRETQILAWIAEGKTNRQIGVILGISTNTVRNCLSRTFIRLDATSRAHAVAIAIKKGLIKGETEQ